MCFSYLAGGKPTERSAESKCVHGEEFRQLPRRLKQQKKNGPCSHFMCWANKSKRITGWGFFFFLVCFLACLFALLGEIGKKMETRIGGTDIRVSKMETRVGYKTDESDVIVKYMRKWRATDRERVEKRKKERGGRMAD